MMKPCTAWWLAIRPKTLSVCAVPVVFGTALAYFEQGHLLWWPALAALLAAILIQIGTNLYNDVGDFERGADTAERLGPPRATAQAWLSARAVRRGARAAFALALLMGAALLAGVMLGSLAAAVITVNNTRDIPTDAVVQKRTLAVRLGRSAMNTVYALELLLPFVLLPWFAVQTNLAWRMTWPVIAGVLAVALYRRFCAAQGVAFNALLAATAQLQWVFAVLLMGALLFP